MIVFIDGPSGSGKTTACNYLVSCGFRHVRLFRGAGEHKSDPGWWKEAGVPYNDWVEDFVLLETFSQLQTSELIVCDRVAVSGLVWEMMAARGLNVSNHPLQPYFFREVERDIFRKILSFDHACFFLHGDPNVLAQRCRQSEELIKAEQECYRDVISRSTVKWTGIDTTKHQKDFTRMVILSALNRMKAFSRKP